MIEVEFKARVESFEKAFNYLKRLSKIFTKISYEDYYFQHPCKDFSKTGEEIRIRIISNENKKVLMTYKSKQIGYSKDTREEIEVETSYKAVDLLEKLGFKKTLWKIKKGWLFLINNLEVSLIEVYGGIDNRTIHLGYFIEVEKKVDSREKIHVAEKDVLNFLKKIPGVGDLEERYYTELIFNSLRGENLER